MKISIFNETRPNEMTYVEEVREIRTPEELSNITCESAWSPFIFKNDPKIGKPYRSSNYFESTDYLVFDIDEALSLNQAIEIVENDNEEVFIELTRHHQKEKPSGKIVKNPCDRFRIIKPLASAITNEKDYNATWVHFSKKLSFVDEQCKDLARFYFPSVKVHYYKKGLRTPVIIASPPADEDRQNNTSMTVKGEHHVRGTLFPSTIKFLKNGTSENWHTQLFKATMDLKEQNYSYEEAVDLLTSATMNYYGYLDEHDLKVVEDVYKKRTGKFELCSRNQSHESARRLIQDFDPPDDEELAENYTNEVKIGRRASKNSLTFLNPAFDEHFKMTYGLTVIGAMTGQGKSTVCHNLIAQILLSESCQKRILLLSNEETLQETYSKIACLMLNLDWKHSYRDCNDQDIQALIDGTAKELMSKVTIITSKPDNYDTSDLDDVISIPEYAKKESKSYAFVVIDYLQTITTSKSRPGLKSWEISIELGNYLKKYAQQSEIPIVVLTQLYSKDGKPDFGSRIQNDKSFVNHAHSCFEVIPDFERNTTLIRCHKQRWGDRQQWEVELQFFCGKLKPLTT